MITFIRIYLPNCMIIALATTLQGLEIQMSRPLYTPPVSTPTQKPQRSWGEYFSSFTRNTRKPTAREIDYTQAYAPRNQAASTRRRAELINAYENAPQRERELAYEGQKRDYERTVRRAEVRNQKLEDDIKAHEETLLRTERNSLKQLIKAQSEHPEEWLKHKRAKDRALAEAAQELKQAEEEYLIKGAGIKEAQKAYKEAANLAVQKEIQAERTYEKYLQNLKNSTEIRGTSNPISGTQSPQTTSSSLSQILKQIDENKKKIADARARHALTTEQYRRATQDHKKLISSQDRPYRSYTFQELVKQRYGK